MTGIIAGAIAGAEVPAADALRVRPFPVDQAESPYTMKAWGTALARSP